MKKVIVLLFVALTLGGAEAIACVEEPINHLAERNDLVLNVLTQLEVEVTELLDRVQLNDYKANFTFQGRMCSEGLEAQATVSVVYRSEFMERCSARVFVKKSYKYIDFTPTYEFKMIQAPLCL